MLKLEYYIGLKDIYGNKYTSKEVEFIASIYYPAYTITKTNGIWKGIQEPSVIVTIVDSVISDATIHNFIGTIKNTMKQEGVLYTITQLTKGQVL